MWLVPSTYVLVGARDAACCANNFLGTMCRGDVRNSWVRSIPDRKGRCDEKWIMKRGNVEHVRSAASSSRCIDAGLGHTRGLKCGCVKRAKSTSKRERMNKIKRIGRNTRN